MNHPRIETRELSDEAIKAIQDVLMLDYYRKRESKDELGKKMAEAARRESRKIQRFLDR